MPYERKGGGWERASPRGHVPIVENELVKKKLEEFRVNRPEASEIDFSHLLEDTSDWDFPQNGIRWVISFDGSPMEVAVDERYPSTRIGYCQIAGVLVDLQRLLAENNSNLVDPSVVRETIQEALQSMVLPGANVCRSGSDTVTDSWRAEIYDIFTQYRIEDYFLFDIFKEVARLSNKHWNRGKIFLERCPACGENGVDVSLETSPCPNCASTLYPTDALRIHEEVSERRNNELPLTRLMSCLEHFTLIGYIHYLAQRKPRVLPHTAFVLDGPLAIFGPSAPFHRPIHRYLEELRKELSKQGLSFPSVVGIEKQGQFVDHARAISGALPKQTIMELPDDYIYSEVLSSRNSGGRTYGADTYYGQKFVYKSSSDQILVFTLPHASSTGGDRQFTDSYPLLPATIQLIENIGTSLYEDAVIPVALAHRFASIPLKTGSRVLKLLSQDIVGD